jgi:hypothetical protein
MTRNFVSRFCIALVAASVFAKTWTDSAFGKQGEPIRGVDVNLGKKPAGSSLIRATDEVPGSDTVYLGGGEGVEWDLPGMAIREQGVQFEPFAGVSPVLTPGGDWSLDAEVDIAFELLLQIDDGPASPHTGSGTMHIVGTAPGGVEPRVFDMEMLSLNLNGLLGGAQPFMLRESPTLASTGKTTITQQPGGLYRIDSFFDVFTEMSIDGGATWAQGVGVPEPSALALVAAACAGLFAVRRR